MFLYADGVFIRMRNINEEREKGCYGHVVVGVGNGVWHPSGWVAIANSNRRKKTEHIDKDASGDRCGSGTFKSSVCLYFLNEIGNKFMDESRMSRGC